MVYSSSSPRRFIALANVENKCHDVVPLEGGKPVSVFMWEDYPRGVAGVEAQREADRLNYDELQRAA